MLGKILFVIVLLVYGFILSRALFEKLFPVVKDQEATGMAKFLVELEVFFKNKGAKFIFSISALVLGIWNLFAPDFSATISPPVVGALIPALILIIDAFIIDPEVIEFLNIPQEAKDKYYGLLDKIKPYMGMVTLISAVLHLAFAKVVFL